MRFINALALISGQIGRPGGGSYFIAPSNRHLDLSWQAKPAPKQVARFFKPTIGRDILAAEPAVKMIWANGTNPVNQSPDSHLVSQAFRSVPFKVVVDAFMTDTADLADLILPCTLNLEQENLNPSYFHDFINHTRPPKVYLAPDSPARAGLDLAKPVFFVSPLGRLEVQMTGLLGLHPEVVLYRRGDWLKLGGGVNQLIADATTDLGGGAAYYAQHARLEN